jgi:hypothetical protein
MYNIFFNFFILLSFIYFNKNNFRFWEEDNILIQATLSSNGFRLKLHNFQDQI